MKLRVLPVAIFSADFDFRGSFNELPISSVILSNPSRHSPVLSERIEGCRCLLEKIRPGFALNKGLDRLPSSRNRLISEQDPDDAFPRTVARRGQFTQEFQNGFFVFTGLYVLAS